MTPILVPFRIVMMLIIAIMIYFSSKIGLLFSDPEVGCLQLHVEKYFVVIPKYYAVNKPEFSQTRDLQPHTGWRKVFQNAMWTSAGYVAFLLLGFRVEIRGEQAARDEAAVLIVAPHTSFMDVFTIALCYASPVARIENKDTCFMWAPQAIGHTIFVNRFTLRPTSHQSLIHNHGNIRRNQESRLQASTEITERALSPLSWPQVFIFAEGTTTNGTALARFGTGGFRPGCPVQPVTIQYRWGPTSITSITKF